MKQIYTILFLLVWAGAWGQAVRLHRLAGPDTTVIATRSYADQLDTTATGIRAGSKSDAVDTLSIIQPSTNILSIKNSVAKLGTQLFNKETRGIYKVEGTKKTKSQASVDTLDADGITQFLLPSGLYAQGQPIGSKLYFTHFRDTNYTDSEILQALVTYSWVNTSISTIVIDTTITLTTQINIPYGVSIEGISRNAKTIFDESSENQRTRGIVYVDINDATKSAFWFVLNSPSGQHEGTMFSHLAIRVLSPLESVIRAREQRGELMYDVNIDGGGFAKYDLVIKGGIDTQIDNCEFGGSTESSVFLEGHTYNNTTTVFRDCAFTGSKYGILYDTTGSIGSLSVETSLFELIDSSAVKIGEDDDFTCTSCYTESIGSGAGFNTAVFEGGNINLFHTGVVGESSGNLTDIGVRVLGDNGTLFMIGGHFTLIKDPVIAIGSDATVKMYFVSHRSTTNQVYSNSYTGISNRDRLTYIMAGMSDFNFPGYNKLHSLRLKDSLTLDFSGGVRLLSTDQNSKLSPVNVGSNEIPFNNGSSITSSVRLTFSTTSGLYSRSAGSTNTTSSLLLQNSNTDNLFRVMSDGSFRVGNNATFIYPVSGNDLLDVNGYGLHFQSQRSGASTTGLASFLFKRDFRASFSSTDRNMMLTGTFNPTSSTANKIALEIRDTLNQTGTASGDWKGLYINPTLTSVLGTANAIETTGGNTSLADKITFSDYGNSSTYDLSTIGKSKGTNPYPVFASDGTIANESNIPASDISSSGDSTNVQSEITGFDTRLDSLEQLFTTGAATPTTDLSGQFTITHGLGTTPTHLSVGNLSGTEYNFEYSCGSTSCTVTVYDGTGTDTTVNSTGISISWAAFR